MAATLHFDPSRTGYDADCPEALRKPLETIDRVLCDYAQPDSTLSLEEVISQTAGFYLPDRGYPIHTTLITLGDQIPYNNAAHTKLTNYFVALGDSKKWYSANNTLDFERAENLFYEKMRIYLWDSNLGPDDRLKEGEDPIEYVNAQAFEANFMSREILSTGRLLYVVTFLKHAMLGAFNENHSEQPLNVRDAWVMGAAQWILWRAKEAFSLVQKPGDPEILKVAKEFWPWQSQKKERAIDDIWPYTWDQWQSWKNGFRAAARNEKEYSSTCRTMAGQAADLMSMQEKALANHEYISSPLKRRY